MNLEEMLGAMAEEKADEVKTDLIYLPIYWTCSYAAQARALHRPGYEPVPAVQQFVDEHLDSNERYFTVVLCDDGIYEQLPENVIVFGAGGVGDIPVPLTCKTHPRQEYKPQWLASFRGVIEAGGPEYPLGEAPRSSWDKDGGGAQTRRKMQEVFGQRSDSRIEVACGAKEADTKRLCDLACSSYFGLAPRGYGLTSYRLYELMFLRTVPVYLYTEPWLPYEDELDWETFCVLCQYDNIQCLPERLEFWLGHRSAALARLDKLVDEYFTLEGTCRQILKKVQSL